MQRTEHNLCNAEETYKHIARKRPPVTNEDEAKGRDPEEKEAETPKQNARKRVVVKKPKKANSEEYSILVQNNRSKEVEIR